MAYGDDNFGAKHQFTFNNTLSDEVSFGGITLTNTLGVFSSAPITRDSTHSLSFTNRGADVQAVPVSDTGASVMSRYAVGGWFSVNEIQGPPTLIYGQGGSTAGLALFLWAGNNVMAQLRNNAGTELVQIYSSFSLEINRPYHFLLRFSGNAFDDEFSFYIDGVKQTSSLSGTNVDTTDIVAHTSPHIWGQSEQVIPVGDSSSTIIKASITSLHSQWWFWNGIDSEMTQDELTDNIVAAGAIPTTTITSGTQVVMQTALNAVVSTYSDAPLAISIEEVTGGGNVSLNLDNVTFSEKISVEIEYQGSGVLTLTNINGSNGSKGTSNVTFLNPSILTLNDIENGTEVRIYATGTDTDLAGIEDVVGNTFSATISTEFIDIVLLSLGNLNQKLENIQVSGNTTISIQQFKDRQYLNN